MTHRADGHDIQNSYIDSTCRTTKFVIRIFEKEIETENTYNVFFDQFQMTATVGGNDHLKPRYFSFLGEFMSKQDFNLHVEK